MAILLHLSKQECKGSATFMTTSLSVPKPAAIPENGAGNVLVIEDDSETNEVIVFSLALEGFGVRGVKNRDEGIEALQQNKYQFVLMDLYMPGMGPREFLTTLYLRCPQCKVILMTAAFDASLEARQLGIHHVLVKPFTLESLIEIIGKVG